MVIDEQKTLILKFIEDENEGYILRIKPSFVPKIMKYLEVWTMNEDFKIEWRIWD